MGLRPIKLTPAIHLLVVLAILLIPRQSLADAETAGGGGGIDDLTTKVIDGVKDGAKRASGERDKHNEKATLKDLMMAAMQGAQLAAALAALAKNKDRGEKLKAADPVQTPSMPSMPEPAKAQESPMPSLPNLAKEEAEKAGEEAAPAALTSGPQFEIPKESETPETPKSTATVVASTNVDLGKIPDTIDRTKIGYDETNKDGKKDAAAGAAAEATFSPANLKGGALAANDLGVKSNLLVTELNTNDNRYAKNVTAPEADGGGGSEHGEKGAAGAGGPADMTEMLNSLLGKGDGAATMGSGQNGGTLDSGTTFARGATTAQKENIFQHASYRFQRLAFEENGVKKNGTAVAQYRFPRPVLASKSHD